MQFPCQLYNSGAAAGVRDGSPRFVDAGCCAAREDAAGSRGMGADLESICRTSSQAKAREGRGARGFAGFAGFKNATPMLGLIFTSFLIQIPFLGNAGFAKPRMENVREVFFHGWAC